MEQQSQRIISIWLSLVSLLFVLLAGVIAWIQHHLLSKGEQVRFFSFVQTSILLYAYLRMVIHIITTRLLKKSSKTFVTMPLAIQEDCAFMIVDAASGFLWIPIILFVVTMAFAFESREQFFVELGPALYISVGIYHVDRIIQLLIHFRLDRFIHHLLACAWTLLIVEWWPSGGDPVIFVFGAFIEGGYKPIWYWFVSACFSCRSGKNGQLGKAYGADILFVASSAEKMSFCGKIFFGYYCSFKSLAVVLMIVYLSIKETLLFWKVFTPFIAMILLSLDVPMMTALYKMTKIEYWRSILHGTDSRAPLEMMIGKTHHDCSSDEQDQTNFDSGEESSHVDDGMEVIA